MRPRCGRHTQPPARRSSGTACRWGDRSARRLRRGVRAALPDAVIAVDHFHVIMLANKAVTAVRQRVTRDLLDRRGRKTDPTWANRRLLLRGRERLSKAALARMWNGCIDNDPTCQILSAWIAKEELRALCAPAARGGHPGEIRDRLHAIYQWCADAQIPELIHARRDDRDLVAGDRGVPLDRPHERPHRRHQPVDQAGETRRLRLPQPGQLPAPGTVALHPAHPPIVSEETDGARLRSKSHQSRASRWAARRRPDGSCCRARWGRCSL